VRSPLLDIPGAVGKDVPAHYGNPIQESRAFSTGVAVVDCSDWGVIRLHGPDRLLWLDSLSSQALAGLAPDTTTESLILDPHGHIEHRFLLTDDGERSWLLTEPGAAPALISWLQTMRFRMQVEIDDYSESLAVLASCGGGIPSSDVVWRDPWPDIGEGSIGYGPEPHPGDGQSVTFFAVPRHLLNPDLVASWAGSMALSAHLIAAGRPLLADVDQKSLPHEWDWLRTAVHLNKGCYRGQETVAKIHNLGHPPRRAVLFHLDGSEGVLPEPGADVRDGDTVIGFLTRAARHYEWGPIGIGLVKRNVSAEHVSISAEGQELSARIDSLTSPTAGATRREALRRR